MRKKIHGFSLIEVVAALAILAILTLIVTQSLISSNTQMITAEKFTKEFNKNQSMFMILRDSLELAEKPFTGSEKHLKWHSGNHQWHLNIQGDAFCIAPEACEPRTISKAFSISYASSDTPDAKLEWYDNWDKDEILPRLVRLRFENGDQLIFPLPSQSVLR